jgi:hypothetical protein
MGTPSVVVTLLLDMILFLDMASKTLNIIVAGIKTRGRTCPKLHDDTNPSTRS